ncbi:type III PLP-dependent enzyme [Aestuariibacter sp. GS-14]|uniref:type III PLP-dependent enzyme n=1 Tax=Aestuariibacter sp. GS-14 TaxID=2590670 RepID=UPI00112EA9D5|nr:type III PLP-dependent enzyme [Aestuariibacter sp. GS-14]TPV59704.1 type III PLP-dependent enzyme [Aestuariibacter sp. GS-14]
MAPEFLEIVPAKKVATEQKHNLAEAERIRRMVALHGSPLLILDCDAVRRQYRALQRALPGVDLHYAIKPLPNAAVVATLREEGAFFDLATNGEVDLVSEAGIEPSRTIHTHPIKRDSDIRYAMEYGCNTFVFDNPDELKKFIPYARKAKLLLRLSFRSPDAKVDLSKKFGCSQEAALPLLKQAAEYGIRVVGLSFHVGSQALDPAKHVEAITACATIVQQAREQGLPKLEIVDIGGGFPVDYVDDVQPINTFCAPIRAALATLPAGTRLIAEPGRFIAAPAMTAVATVMGKSMRDGRWWYYMDDGVYGSYSGRIFDHAQYPIDSLDFFGERSPSVLAGPTCDSIDVIEDNIMLPELECGALIVGRMMGAYTSATATEFNFFKKADIVVINERVGEDCDVLPLMA